MSRIRSTVLLPVAAGLLLTACSSPQQEPASESVTGGAAQQTTAPSSAPVVQPDALLVLQGGLAAEGFCEEPFDEALATTKGGDDLTYIHSYEQVLMPAHTDLLWCADEFGDDHWDTLVLEFEDRAQFEAAAPVVDDYFGIYGHAYGSAADAEQQWLMFTSRQDRVAPLMRVAAQAGGVWINSRDPLCANPLTGGAECEARIDPNG
ncbi:hypothetical protein ACI798_14400 [Geodermatophilus sp. SYSU D01045]